MSTEIIMPNLSQTTQEVKLLKWRAKEGQKIEKGDILCEVETDKVVMDVESFAGGTILKFYGEPGSMVEAGSVIAVLGEPGEKVLEKTKDAGKDGHKVETREDKISKDIKTLKEVLPEIRATKLVKNIAYKKNIDISNVKGTGPGGTITRKDLEDHISLHLSKEIINEKVEEETNIYALSRNQQAVSANLIKSKSDIPHYYLKVQIFADEILKRKQEDKANNKAVSMYSYLIYAASRVLEGFPRLNSYFKDNKIHQFPEINIGLAVAVEDELYVPVVRNANKKEISGIDREVKSLVSKAQNKELEPGDISRGTFTMSNLGMFPVEEFYGIINYPQAVLVAIGRIKKIPYVEEDNSIHIKNAFNITASIDHRIASGAQGAEFLARFKKFLEEEILIK